jgi:hypothetical protein
MAPKKKDVFDKLLKGLYYDTRQPGAYGGVSSLRQGVSASKKKAASRSKVKSWLNTQDTYTLHKPVRYNFKRRRVIVGDIDAQWQADLVDVARLSKENEGHNFLLTVIDVLSKYAWVVPLKNKTGRSLVEAFEKIFAKGRVPERLQTDKGTEFLNKEFQSLLKNYKVKHFTTHNVETKASIVERFNRTLKTRMWRYFTRRKTHRYLGILTNLVRAYNGSHHRSIGRTPESVSSENVHDVLQKLYGGKTATVATPKFKVGDQVRISKARRTFKKGYLPNWSEELFTVSKCRLTDPPVYILKDYNGDVLDGTFYEPELQRVTKTDNVYRIEHVLDERGPAGKREILVKWLGYPATFNSWIPKSNIQRYKS